MTIHRLGTSFALSVALALAFVAGAAATPPTHEDIGAIPYAADVSCAPYGFSFSNQISGVETLRIDTFYDAAGVATKVVLHDAFRETDRNSVTGKAVPFSANRTETFDLVAGTRTVDGRSFLATVPGAGVVIIDVGRVVFDAPFHVSFAAGPHEPLFGDIDELVCNVLAG